MNIDPLNLSPAAYTYLVLLIENQNELLVVLLTLLEIQPIICCQIIL